MALVRRLDYRLRPRLRRETCKRCWRENPVGFSVPDKVWRASVPARHLQNVLCLHCFDRYATQREIDWAVQECNFYPVAGATCSSRPSAWPCIRRIPRLWSAWLIARHSRSSASSSSSDTSARCRTGCLCASAMGRLRAYAKHLLFDDDAKRLCLLATAVNRAGLYREWPVAEA